jgi:F-type H+-transporting ATPase subunit delta
MARPSTAARRYAEAAFQVALADDQLDTWHRDLNVAADTLGMAEVAPVVENPAIPIAERQALVSRLLEGSIGPGPLRLVNLLVERGRVATLARVIEQYESLLNAHRGIVVATVTSAVPLTDQESDAIRGRVESMAGATVELRTAVDPALLGGLTIQVKDQLLDASIRGRLERLRDDLTAGRRAR